MYCAYRIGSKSGKCIAWIRNSVDDAIKVYRQLLARGVIPASSLSLFHSRFAFSDRQRIETETLARFGKVVVYRDHRKSLFVHK